MEKYWYNYVKAESIVIEEAENWLRKLTYLRKKEPVFLRYCGNLDRMGLQEPEFDIDDDRTYLNTIIHIRDGFERNEIMSKSMSES